VVTAIELDEPREAQAAAKALYDFVTTLLDDLEAG
jgi:hypothetical protein